VFFHLHQASSPIPCNPLLFFFFFFKGEKIHWLMVSEVSVHVYQALSFLGMW
jgi:hypothetical protein